MIGAACLATVACSESENLDTVVEQQESRPMSWYEQEYPITNLELMPEDYDVDLYRGADNVLRARVFVEGENKGYLTFNSACWREKSTTTNRRRVEQLDCSNQSTTQYFTPNDGTRKHELNQKYRF